MALQTPLRLNISTVVTKIIVTHLIASVISVSKGDLPSTIIASKRNTRLYAYRSLPIFGLRHFDHLVIISTNFCVLIHSVNWLIIPNRKVSLRKTILRSQAFQLFVLRLQDLYSVLHQLQLLFKFLLTVMLRYIASN